MRTPGIMSLTRRCLSAPTEKCRSRAPSRRYRPLVPTLLHFTAPWAEPICGPHRREVAVAAETLGWAVREVDYDGEPATSRAYEVPNVPAVALEGRPTAALLVGAHPAEAIVRHFRNTE